MASGGECAASRQTVLQQLTAEIQATIKKKRILIQMYHTRQHFGIEPIYNKSHCNPKVDPDKLTAAVVLEPRNTEIQQNRPSQYCVVFEAEFDEAIGFSQKRCDPVRYCYIVITKNSDQTHYQNYDFVIVMSYFLRDWKLQKQNGPYNTTSEKRYLSRDSVKRVPP